MICPFCASENIFFSKKKSIYFCEDCDACFETPSFPKGMRIFISYGHDKNAGIVSKIKEYLNNHGYDVWIDTSEIPHGTDWRERITNGILGSNGILSFLSKHSVRDPGVCIDELKIAICLKHAYLKTVLLEKENDVQPPKFVTNTQWIDLSGWENIIESDWDDFFERKMRDILATLNSDEARKFNAEIELLTKRLSVFDNNTKVEHLLKQIFIGREWLAKEVHTWMNSTDSQTMMIYGVPGSGKSAFCANLSQYNPNMIGGIFFEWNNSLLTNADYVTKLFALKLAVRLPDYRRILCNILHDEKEAEQLLKNHHDRSLFDLLVLNPLQCCINGGRDTYAFIFDGLDETSPEVAQLLIRKAQQLPDWLKVIFTSRYEETENSHDDLGNVIFLDNTSENNTIDIEQYICCRLQINPERSGEIAQKCEGSFMYAKTLCDSVSSGKLLLNEIDSLPRGINLFYHDFFNRLFGDFNSFTKTKSFLELLSIEDEIPEELFRKCLNIDKYEQWEIRNTLKSLVRTAVSEDFRRFKTFKFVHKSIKDWLMTIELSGKYYIDPVNGYKALIELNGDVDSSDSVTFESGEVKSFYINHYPKWLINAGYYDKYRDLLLDSFDGGKIRENFSKYCNSYTYYYSLHSVWRYADLLPENYDIDAILTKFDEIVSLPKEFIVSRFSHRSFQIISLMLKECMHTGRFAAIFFKYMSQMSYDGYFRSGASDDFETRDGWDKYYMTRDAVACLKKCDALAIPVPDNVRRTCERMKLSYNYFYGKNDGMFLHGENGCWKYGILTEPELFKDICILDDDVEARFISNVKEERSGYNTLSLLYYLTHSDEEDLSFIRLCMDNLAELDLACEQAISVINNDAEKRFHQTQLKNVVRRIEFIRSLKDAL